jgi:hypothetical protein
VSRLNGCGGAWLARRFPGGGEHVAADVGAWGGDKPLGLQALRDLRAARRRRYAENVDMLEVLYRLYLGVLFGGWGLALISGALADVRVNHHTVQEIHRHGPAALGMLVAIAAAAGLRSGGRGGPLVLEAADVQHVLLSPVDRGAALRGLAVRRIRAAGFVGVVAGLIAGNFAFRRLPGRPAEWLLCGSVFGATVAVWGLADAMIASGRRMHRAVILLLAVLIVGWSVADLVGERTTSPATMLGQLVLWPLHRGSDSFALPAAGLAACAVFALFGLAGLAGTSLEAARRRAGLAAQLRFAVTTQDLRAIILLRRQLASEIPRRRPWLRLARSDRLRRAVWHRDWQSFLRWPLVRVVRVCVLGVVAGISLFGAWRGTTPLVLVASFALMVAAFDAVEPIGQEVDHPMRFGLLPVAPREVIRRHLVAPVVLMAGVSLIAVATVIAAGASGGLVEVVVVMVLPTALLSLCCAALSVTNDPFKYVLTPEIGYLQTGFPVVLVIIGVSGPVLVARAAARHGAAAAGAAVGCEFVVLLICAVVIAWLGHRISAAVPVRA